MRPRTTRVKHRIFTCSCLIILFVTLSQLTFAESIIRIERIDPLQEQLQLSNKQLDSFLGAYQDYAAKRKSGIRRARLKARGADDASRRINRAKKKTNEKFDEAIHSVLNEDQFTRYLDVREQIIASLSNRRSGFSDSSIPNPGGLLADPGFGGIY